MTDLEKWQKNLAGPLRKPYPTKSQDVDTQTRQGHAAFTVRCVDRDGDVLEPAGLDMANYLADPVVLLNHGADLPIGNAGISPGDTVQKNDDELEAVWTFGSEEHNPKAELAWKCWRDHLFSSVSQGFLPNMDALSRKKVLQGQTGYYIPEAELLELSVVTLRSNPQALRRSKSFVKAYQQMVACSPVYAPYFKVTGEGRVVEMSEFAASATPTQQYAIITDFLDQRTPYTRECSTIEQARTAAHTMLAREKIRGIQLVVLGAHVGYEDDEPVYATVEEFYDDPSTKKNICISCEAMTPDVREQLVYTEQASVAPSTDGTAKFAVGQEKAVGQAKDRQLAKRYTKDAIPFEDTPVASFEHWDEDRATENLRRWASEDNSGRKEKIDWNLYERGFAWVDEENSTNFGGYKLPHHDIEDGDLVVVRNGVKAAIGAFNGARAELDVPEEDRPGIRDHLNQEAEKFEDLDPIEERASIDGHPQPIGVNPAGTTDPHAGEILEEPVGPYKWYVWDQDQARQWLEDHDFGEVLKEEKSDNFHDFRLADPDEFDDFSREWQGLKNKPEDEPDDDDLPRLLQFGIPEDGESEVQAVFFYHGEKDLAERDDEGSDEAKATALQDPLGDDYTAHYTRKAVKAGLKKLQQQRAHQKSVGKAPKLLPNIASRLYNTPLVIHPDKLGAILSGIGDRVGAEGVHTEDIPAEMMESKRASDVKPEGAMAVIPIMGTLIHRGLLGDNEASSGLTPYGFIDEAFEQALNDPGIKGILLDIDSPGGEVSGNFDVADRIFEARGEKPIWAIANESAFSAAYAIASAADRIIVPRTAGVGSVGVVAMHVDQSEAEEMHGFDVSLIYAGDKKVHGNPHEPLSDEAESDLQAEINRIYEIFVRTVARNRGLSEEAVRATEADVFMGEEAVQQGFADEVASPKQARSDMQQQLHTDDGDTSGATGAGDEPSEDGEAVAAFDAILGESEGSNDDPVTAFDEMLSDAEDDE